MYQSTLCVSNLFLLGFLEYKKRKKRWLDQDPTTIVILPFSPVSFVRERLQPALNPYSVSENPHGENTMGGTSHQKIQ